MAKVSGKLRNVMTTLTTYEMRVSRPRGVFAIFPSVIFASISIYQ